MGDCDGPRGTSRMTPTEKASHRDIGEPEVEEMGQPSPKSSGPGSTARAVDVPACWNVFLLSK